MNAYDLNLDFYYQTFDNFKQKATIILKGMTDGCRIRDYIRFSSYGTITTETRKAEQIHIEELEKFNRSRTNCLIYDLTFNKYNPGKYNKLFIYKTNMSRDNAFYGYIFYNTETGETFNKYNVEFADDKLCQYIYMSLVSLANKKMFDHYSKKYDAVKNRNGLTVVDAPGIKEYQEMTEYYEKFQKTPFNPKEYPFKKNMVY